MRGSGWVPWRSCGTVELRGLSDVLYRMAIV